VQNAMQRLPVNRQPIDLTDLTDSPKQDRPLETNKVVPDSFADWLAQPSQTITAGPETEQGVFIEVNGDSCVQIVGSSSVESRKR
jgi:hypothetical protein